ncbi:hypothetical protein JB92DRAFT_3087694 [Gautieria morchelliformis]|nr:hypothetical protein JB92DRAFT_3087694 [Gautieria morchelliformis]
MAKIRSGNEDTVPDAYPYFWKAEESSLNIEEFVKKYKPSMVQDDGTKPWLWVQNSNAASENENRTQAVEEATKILAEATTSVQKINDDGSISTRSNKKTGAKSKKQLKEEVQAEATQKLKKVHERYAYKSGKWLAFVAPNLVDTVWSRIATSLTTGPLSQTSAYLAKVATTPANETSAQRLICIYTPDVLHKQQVTEVMRVLLRNHGLSLSGVKSNLYTEIGLDSKHSSRIQSTMWKNTDLLPDNQIKELKDGFYAELKVEQEQSVAGHDAKKVPTKPKPAEDDPFASSEDEEPRTTKTSQVEKSAPKRKNKGEGEGDGGRPKKKAR